MGLPGTLGGNSPASSLAALFRPIFAPNEAHPKVARLFRPTFGIRPVLNRPLNVRSLPFLERDLHQKTRVVHRDVPKRLGKRSIEMRHVIAILCGTFIGVTVWLSTGNTPVGIVVALGLSVLFSLGMGVAATRRS